MKLKELFRATTEVTNYEDPLLTAIMSKTAITRSSAMEIPQVQACIDDISNIIACIPFVLYQETIDENGKRKVVRKSDYRLRLLNEETGDTLNAFDFKKALVEDYLLDKGGFAYIEKNGNTIKSLRYIEPLRVTSNYVDSDSIFKKFWYTIDAKKFESYEMIKLLRNNQGKIGKGKAVIDEITSALQTSYTTMTYQLSTVSSGGNKRGFLQSKRKLGADEIKALKSAWSNLYSTNTENAVILNEGLEFKEASNNSVELQLNQTIANLNNQIKAIFHYYDDDDKTFKHAILPILKSMTNEINSVLLLESEKEQGFYFDFDSREVTRGSILDRYNAYKVAKDTGFMTLNEMRYEENMDEIDGLDIIPMGLADVLFDVKNQTYYTPNTNSTYDGKGVMSEDESTDKK